MMEKEINFKNYKGIPFKIDLNYYRIPVTKIPLTESGTQEYNSIYQYLKILTEKGRAFPLVRTPSGGISISYANYYARANEFPKWDVQHYSDGGEITYVDLDWICRIQCRVSKPNSEDFLFGHTCYQAYRQIAKKIGHINLDDYKREDGKEIWKTIPKPLIKFDQEAYENLVWKNVHHLDLNFAYGYGMAKEYPEFMSINSFLYENRYKKPGYKDVLNKTIGYFASSKCSWKLSHFTKAAKEYTNARVMELRNKLIESGRLPILFNTDGIWYQGDKYIDSENGLKFGQWKHDHVDCTFRAKSPGAYEYIENGQYYPVVRGLTLLDKTLKRTQWKWGDIYNSAISTYVFYPDIGYVEKPINELELMYGKV